ncbi:hypothetical protein phiST2_0371 [Vibrio phage phi-ST2]|nr:hypothetical protein phiST2_0371 [Vibrio phage phi-ST2]URQ03706.1 hypothetical protein PVA23_329 [Vibrio phage PVA23]
MSKSDYYVYLLIDPRTNKVFYVGKGRNERAKFHESEVRRDISSNRVLNSAKKKEINDIIKSGYDVVIKIVKDNLTEDLAFGIESNLIESFGIENLSNAVRGHHRENCERFKLSMSFDSELSSIYTTTLYNVFNRAFSNDYNGNKCQSHLISNHNVLRTMLKAVNMIDNDGMWRNTSRTVLCVECIEVVYLAYMLGADMSKITFATSSLKKIEWVSERFGIRTQYNVLGAVMEKFDVCIMNPPYERTQGKLFVEKCMEYAHEGVIIGLANLVMDYCKYTRGTSQKNPAQNFSQTLLDRSREIYMTNNTLVDGTTIFSANMKNMIIIASWDANETNSTKVINYQTGKQTVVKRGERVSFLLDQKNKEIVDSLHEIFKERKPLIADDNVQLFQKGRIVDNERFKGINSITYPIHVQLCSAETSPASGGDKTTQIGALDSVSAMMFNKTFTHDKINNYKDIQSRIEEEQRTIKRGSCENNPLIAAFKTEEDAKRMFDWFKNPLICLYALHTDYMQHGYGINTVPMPFCTIEELIDMAGLTQEHIEYAQKAYEGYAE